MNLKITMTVEPDAGEQLVGLLAKAYGRGELGISGLLVEREGQVVAHVVKPPALRAIRQSTIAKMVAKGQRKRGYELGMRAIRGGKPNGVTITLRALKHNASRDGIRAMLEAHGFKSHGMSPTLSKLQQRGYVKNVGIGVWRLTPKGEELEARLNAKVEHHDKQDD
jgi:hypothetical protein